MFRETVTVEDAVVVVSVMECSMQGGALLGNVNALHTSFPDDPCEQYKTQCQIVLERLGLTDILHKELQRLSRLQNTRSDSPKPTEPHSDHTNESAASEAHSKKEVTTDSDPGLDWFHGLSSPTGTNSMLHTSPIITSTQNPTTTRNMAVLPSNSSSLHCKDSVWEKEANVDIEVAGEPSSVVDKGSKKLRGKRLREMKQALLRSEERDGEDRVFGETEDLEPVFSPDTIPSHSTPMTGKKQHIKRKSAAISPPEIDQEPDFREESGENLRSKLTNFTFKPRERMTRTEQSVGKTISDVLSKDKTPVTGDEGARPNAPQLQEKNKAERKNRSNPLSPAEGSSALKKLRLAIENKTRDLSTEVSHKENRAQKGSTEDAEHKQRQLLQNLDRLPPGDGNNTNKPSLSPPETDHPQTKVASSTLAKLSRFAFIGSAEEKTTDKTIPAPAETKVVNEDSTKDVVTIAQVEITNTSTVSTVQRTGSPKITNPQSRSNLTKETEAKTAAPETANMRTELSNRREGAGQDTMNPKKRRCFELGTGGPAGLFSGLSLFSSSVVDDEDLDVDWDKECSKR